MAKINYESELMKNQKAAAVLPPQQAFTSLQSKTGRSIFLAINDAQELHIIKEQSGTVTGWGALDLSSELASFHSGKTIAAKTFSAAQQYVDGTITIALAVRPHGDTSDYLYLLSGLSNADDAAWMTDASQRTWVARPYDDTEHPLDTLNIADVYLVPEYETNSDTAQLICQLALPPNQYLQNYTVILSGDNAWAQLQTAQNYDTLRDQTVGKAANSSFSGLYQLTSINESLALNFTPMRSFFGPPTVLEMQAPVGASKLAALAVDNKNNTNLFVAGTEAIYVFSPTQQTNGGTGVVIIQSALIMGLKDFYAHQTEQEVVLWGLNQQGQVFYSKCAKGSEAEIKSWSAPIPLLDNIERISSYINSSGSITIFAYSGDQNLTQLIQDPASTLWQQRNILLPPPDTSQVVEYCTFTTHIRLADDNNFVLADTALKISATQQCTVFINDNYHILSPTVPIQVNTDATGNLSIVQETQSLGAICFKLTMADMEATVNPMTKLVGQIAHIQSGDDLGNVQVTDEQGNKRHLLSSDVTQDQKDSTAAALKKFVNVASQMPADGSTKSNVSTMAVHPTNASAFVARPDTIWGISFEDGQWKYHAGEASIKALGLQASGSTFAMQTERLSVDDMWDAIVTEAGSLWRWLKNAFNEVKQFFVTLVDGVYHFFIELGGILYRTILNTINDVVQAVEFVFNKIAVSFEDLIQWLGFIFNWNDILYTHRVLKSLLKNYMANAVNNLGSYRSELQQVFNQVVEFIDDWGNILDNIPPSLSRSSLGSASTSGGTAPGQDSPQSNWAINHLKANSAGGTTSASPNSGITGDIEALLKPLLDALEREKEVFQAAFNSFQTNVIDKIHTLSLAGLLKAIIGIIADALLESIENVLLTAIDVFGVLAEGILDILDAPIDIPVISWVYRKITCDDLSILDVGCLIVAIPVTIGYKLIANTDSPPFSDDATTQALIKAPDFATFKRIANGQPSASPVLMASAMAAADTILISINNIIALSGGIASLVGSISLSIFSPLKTKYPSNNFFSVANGLSYLPYVFPNIAGQIPDLHNKKWWAIMNEIIADLATIKAMIDMGIGLTKVGSPARKGWDPVSPWLDFGMNILWQVPTSAALFDEENDNLAGVLSFWGGTAFDCSGILSPLLADDEEPISWGIAVALAAFFNVAYGGLALASSISVFKS